MGSLENMVKAMKTIPLYSLKIYTTVYKELQSYAVELDMLTETVDELINECFLSTASDYGLTFYEKTLGRERSDLSIEKRREMLIQAQLMNVNDNTLSGFYRFFLSVGLECDIVENPYIFDIYILAKGRDYSAAEQDYIIEKAKNFLPCHLTFTVDFRTVNWDVFDSFCSTFDNIENKNLTWDDFERYKEDE